MHEIGVHHSSQTKVLVLRLLCAQITTRIFRRLLEIFGRQDIIIKPMPKIGTKRVHIHHEVK